MTNRERVLAALNHEQPDKTPYHIGFTEKAHAKMADFYGDADFADRIGNCFTKMNTEPAESWREVRPNIWEDQFGVQWDRSIDRDIGVVVNCLVNADNVDEFAFPDPDDVTRYESYQRMIEGTEDGFFTAEIGFSLFERAWTLAGMENLLMAMVADKKFVHRLFDRILEFNLRVIDNVCRYDVDMMYFGDDWGQQRG